MTQFSESKFPQKEMSAGQGFLVLFGVGLFILAIKYASHGKMIVSEIDYLLLNHQAFVWIQASALLLNLIALGGAVSDLLDGTKQGKKLEKLSGKKKIHKNLIKKVLFSIGVGILVFMILYLVKYPEENLRRLFSYGLRLNNFFRINLSFAAEVIAYLIARAYFSVSEKVQRQSEIPLYPKVANSIVIGTEGEDENNPQWVVLGEKALNGGILVSGSPGTGKTAGFIKPVLRQIFENFHPRAACLIIDPKGGLVKDVIDLVESLGLEDHFLHLHLDGNVTFNPIYREKALQRARFQEVVDMITSAQANLSNGGKRDEFWDSSSNNLMKNSLIFCAATEEYYTLRSLYQVLSRAIYDPSLISDLEACLNQVRFNAEEKHNIQCAHHYFKNELSQLDEKVRTGIFATATSFLNQFEEYRVSQIFCPKKEDLTLLSMDEVIDQGKILLFDIDNVALAKSMGTFIKLHFERSNLRRINHPTRPLERSAVLLVDEYQNVVSTGTGKNFGDNTYYSMSREAKAINIVAVQSVSSIENAVGNEKASKELIQNFRTRLAAHSTDLPTIRIFQELWGKEVEEKLSRSYSEQSHKPVSNLIAGGFESLETHLSESITKTEQKEFVVTAQDFARLKTFECFGQIYDGLHTHFKRIYLKPDYLRNKATLQKEIWETFDKPKSDKTKQKKRTAWGTALFSFFYLFCSATHSYGAFLFPNVCTLLKTSQFSSCFNLKVTGACVCGIIPRPCLQIAYYVPTYFVEVLQTPKASYFRNYPEAAVQLASVLGAETISSDDDQGTHSFQAHIIPVPLAREILHLSKVLPCGGGGFQLGCFRAMSEHLGEDWRSGKKDQMQPNFKAWTLAGDAGIKACMAKGAVESMSPGADLGAIPLPTLGDSPASCSHPGISIPPIYPPSKKSACNGWGIFYPRYGTYDGPSHFIGALQTAARLKSLATDAFFTVTDSNDEYWQIIEPQSSSCFREGENNLLHLHEFHEMERLKKLDVSSHYLFAVWRKSTCCVDIHEFPKIWIAVEAILKAACQGVG